MHAIPDAAASATMAARHPVLARPPAPAAANRPLDGWHPTRRPHQLDETLTAAAGPFGPPHPSSSAHPLRADWVQALPQLQGFGPIEWRSFHGPLTWRCRTDGVPLRAQGHAWQIDRPDVGLSLSLRPDACQRAFAVREAGAEGWSRSLRCYDPHGRELLRVVLQAGADVAAYARLVEQHAAPDRPTTMPDHLRPGHGRGSKRPTRPQPSQQLPWPDVAAHLRGRWLALRDPAQWPELLPSFHLTLEQALRLAGPDLALPLEPGALQELLQRAAQSGLALRLAARHAGLEWHRQGPWVGVVPAGAGLLAHTPDLQLHLDEPGIGSVWRVRRPGQQGLRSTLEVLHPDGHLLLSISDATPGIGRAERCEWRNLLAQVASDDTRSCLHPGIRWATAGRPQ